MVAYASMLVLPYPDAQSDEERLANYEAEQAYKQAEALKRKAEAMAAQPMRPDAQARASGEMTPAREFATPAPYGGDYGGQATGTASAQQVAPSDWTQPQPSGAASMLAAQPLVLEPGEFVARGEKESAFDWAQGKSLRTGEGENMLRGFGEWTGPPAADFLRGSPSAIRPPESASSQLGTAQEELGRMGIDPRLATIATPVLGSDYDIGPGASFPGKTGGNPPGISGPAISLEDRRQGGDGRNVAMHELFHTFEFYLTPEEKAEWERIRGGLGGVEGAWSGSGRPNASPDPETHHPGSLLPYFDYANWPGLKADQQSPYAIPTEALDFVRRMTPAVLERAGKGQAAKAQTMAAGPVDDSGGSATYQQPPSAYDAQGRPYGRWNPAPAGTFPEGVNAHQENPFDIPVVSPFLRDVVQPAAGDIGAAIGRGPQLAGAGRAAPWAEDVGRFLGEAAIPVTGPEIILELIPGIGAVPGAVSAIRKLAPEVLQAAKRGAPEAVRAVRAAVEGIEGAAELVNRALTPAESSRLSFGTAGSGPNPAPATPVPPVAGATPRKSAGAGVATKTEPLSDLEAQMQASIEANKARTQTPPAQKAARRPPEATPKPTGSVTQVDGARVPASPETVEAAVRRALVRKTSPQVVGPGDASVGEMTAMLREIGGMKVGDAPDAVRKQVAAALLRTRTQGGKRLLEGVDDAEVLAAIDRIGGENVVIIPGKAGPGGRHGAVRLALREPGGLKAAVEAAEAEPTVTRQGVVLKRGPMEPTGVSGGGGPVPPSRVATQPMFGDDWRPGVPLWRKAGQWAGDVLTVIPRAMLTAFDYSYPLRQGGLLGARHQKEFWANFDTGFRSMFSEDLARARMAQIEANPLRPQNLAITSFERGSNFIDREEDFISRLVDKIPGLKQSARGAAVFINGLRNDTATTFIRTQMRHGRTLNQPDFVKDVETYANYVNRATGRGNLGNLETAIGGLNQVFFSARRNVAMVQTPGYLINSSPAIRKEAWMDFVTFFGMGVGTLKLADLAGAEVGIDPTSADFGKIKVGSTRVDIWGGYQQLARVVYKVGAGQMRNPGSGPEFADAAIPFIRSKVAPQTGLAWDILSGKDFLGQPVEIGSARDFGNRLIPLAWQGLSDAIKEDGAMGAGLALTGFFGTGVQSYTTQRDADAAALKELGPGAEGKVAAVRAELNRIGKEVGYVGNSISNFKLSDEQQDLYQQAATWSTNATLAAVVGSRAWANLNDGDRVKVTEKLIAGSRDDMREPINRVVGTDGFKALSPADQARVVTYLLKEAVEKAGEGLR